MWKTYYSLLYTAMIISSLFIYISTNPFHCVQALSSISHPFMLLIENIRDHLQYAAHYRIFTTAKTSGHFRTSNKQPSSIPHHLASSSPTKRSNAYKTCLAPIIITHQALRSNVYPLCQVLFN